MENDDTYVMAVMRNALGNFSSYPWNESKWDSILYRSHMPPGD